MHKQLGNEIGESQGISIVLHKDDGGRSDNPSYPQKSKIALETKEKVRIYTVATASTTSLLDQRRLVHLYPRIQHLPEMCNDGFIDVASVRVNLDEKKKSS